VKKKKLGIPSFKVAFKKSLEFHPLKWLLEKAWNSILESDF
jgi:hypothetical protein